MYVLLCYAVVLFAIVRHLLPKTNAHVDRLVQILPRQSMYF